MIGRLCIAALLPACLAACAPPQALSTECRFGSVTRIYLGRQTPGGTVTDVQWDRFVADSVTPRFPQGFTVLAGQGQWQASDGRILKEDTRVIELVHTDDALARARVRAVAAAYQRQFAQEAVLLSTSPSVQCNEGREA